MAKKFDPIELQEIVENAGPLAIIKLRDVLENADLNPQGVVATARALSDLVAQMQGALQGKPQEEVMRAIVWDPAWVQKISGLVLHFAEWGAIPHVPKESVESVVKEWFDGESDNPIAGSSESPDIQEA